MQYASSPFISAKLLKYSQDKSSGKRIATFELEYPRYIHGEVLTHRLFSRNSSSSRAIPVKKKIGMVWNNPIYPIYWGQNKRGMQSSEEVTGWKKTGLKFTWNLFSKLACIGAWGLSKLGLHKQWAGRVVEPFELHKIVMTSTELDNWFWLRDDEDAQPEIRDLAQKMYYAINTTEPQLLSWGEYHLPYVQSHRDENEELIYCVNGEEVTLSDAIKVSASCCAQVSYRVLDMSLEKAIKIHDALVLSEPAHYSPFEHQATPCMTPTVEHSELSEGETHVDRDGYVWSGNFKGWIQNRQLMYRDLGHKPMTVK